MTAEQWSLRLDAVGMRRDGGGEPRLAGLDLELVPGATVALVGESGAGKTTAACIAAGLDRASEGAVLRCGVDVRSLDRAGRRTLRREVQLVTQDPSTAFDPRWTVERTLSEPMARFGTAERRDRPARVAELLEKVGLDPVLAARKPAELSGGQLQRVSLARALACGPKALVLDEATSALDASTQDRVLALLDSLQAELGLAYLYVLHDLAVARRVADEVVVLRAGRVEEHFGWDGWRGPHGPHLRSLIDASLSLDQPRGALLG